MAGDYRPPRPSGTDSTARFMQWVWDTLVKMLGTSSTSTVKVDWTTKGPRFHAAAQKGGVESSGGPQQFRVKSVQGDYLTCRTWGGPVGAEVEGSVDILVAKLPELRHSWGHDNGDGSYTEYNVDGKDLTYTYQARSGVVDGQRTETDGTVTTVSIVVPVWHCAEVVGAPYSVIYASQPTGGTGLSVDGVDVLWLMSDYRYWGRVTA